MTQKSHPSTPLVSPDCIAAGIGLADRREICGLLAVLEATTAIELAQGAVSAIQRRLGLDAADTGVRAVRLANEIFQSSVPNEALRHRLWLEIGRALGGEELLPLSARTMRGGSSAIGVLAAERLGPDLLSKQHRTKVAETNWILDGAKLRVAEASDERVADRLSFPDIVAAEFDLILQGLADSTVAADIDPEVVQAIRSGQTAMAAAVASGGGWAAFAAAVGSTGFAPYILAAQLSALIPLVSGPALVSFLAVLINPITVVAGVAALGVWAVKGRATSVRATVASRLAVLLAVRGTMQPEAGVAALVSDFRSLPRLARHDREHLSIKQANSIEAKHLRVEKRLGRPLPPALGIAPGSWGQPSDTRHKPLDVETASVSVLTAGDMLFHAIAIDPAVLRAADFSRNLDLGGPFDLAAHASAFASEGSQTSLRGYTAEQVVLALLADEGRSVELAATSTTAGFDLLVDGCPVQVKCGTSLSILEEHFAKYPDIPVIADARLAAHAELVGQSWSFLVTTVDGFDLDAVETLVARSLASAEALGSVDVPFFAMAVGVARGVHRAATGEIPVGDLPAWIILDLSIRGGLTAAGKIGGGFVGLLALGPAGAVILGPVLGVASLMGTQRAYDMVDRAIHLDWHNAVVSGADGLRRALTAAIERRVTCLIERQAAIEEHTVPLPPDLSGWLDARALDDVVAAVEMVDELPPANDVMTAMQLIVHAAQWTAIDPEVTAARSLLLRALRDKPSTTEAAQRLWGKMPSWRRRGK